MGQAPEHEDLARSAPVREKDLTGRARIRNAAFALVAQRGVEAVTMRAIAQRAGVSPSLVVHHFGSKQGVLDAVSEWVTEVLSEINRDADPTVGPAEAHRRRRVRFEQMAERTPLFGEYLRRMLLEGDEHGSAWFTGAVNNSEAGLRHREALGIARPSPDVRITAAMLVLLGFAPLLMRPQLEDALGLDFDDDKDRARWRAAETALLSTALYPADVVTEPVDED